jgi:hypothetical protein
LSACVAMFESLYGSRDVFQFNSLFVAWRINQQITL